MPIGTVGLFIHVIYSLAVQWVHCCSIRTHITYRSGSSKHNCCLILHWFLQTIPWPVSKSVEKTGVGKCVISQHPMTLIPMGQEIKQEPRPIEKSHNSELGNRRGSRSHSACGLVVPGPWRLLSWESSDFSMGMDCCYSVFTWSDGSCTLSSISVRTQPTTLKGHSSLTKGWPALHSSPCSGTTLSLVNKAPN